MFVKNVFVVVSCFCVLFHLFTFLGFEGRHFVLLVSVAFHCSYFRGFLLSY